MSTNQQFISVRETAQVLNISEKKVMDLIEERKLQAYRIAEKFLRLKKSEVLNLRNTGHIVTDSKQLTYTSADRMKDFLYFNDFYIVSAVAVVILLYVIFLA